MKIEKLTIEKFNEIVKTINVEYSLKPRFASTKVCLTETDSVILIDEINLFVMEVKTGNEIKNIISSTDNNKGWFINDSNNETYLTNLINSLEEKEWI